MLKMDMEKGNKKPMKAEHTTYERAVSPFLLIAPQGGYLHFSSYVRLYAYTIELCWQQSKGGWLDVVMFLWDWTSLEWRDAVIFTQTHLPNIKDGVYVLLWNGVFSNAEYRMSHFLMFLHKLTGSTFSEEAFNEAWDEFKKKQENRKNKKINPKL